MTWWRPAECSWDVVAGTQQPPYELGASAEGYGRHWIRRSGLDWLEAQVGVRPGTLKRVSDDDDRFEDGSTPYRPASCPSLAEWGPVEPASTKPLEPIEAESAKTEAKAAEIEAERRKRVARAATRERIAHERIAREEAERITRDRAAVRERRARELVPVAAVTPGGPAVADASGWTIEWEPTVVDCPYEPPGHQCGWLKMRRPKTTAVILVHCPTPVFRADVIESALHG